MPTTHGVSFPWRHSPWCEKQKNHGISCPSPARFFDPVQLFPPLDPAGPRRPEDPAPRIDRQAVSWLMHGFAWAAWPRPGPGGSGGELAVGAFLVGTNGAQPTPKVAPSLTRCPTRREGGRGKGVLVWTILAQMGAFGPLKCREKSDWDWALPQAGKITLLASDGFAMLRSLWTNINWGKRAHP